MTATTFFDKFSEEYESQDRYKKLFYRWIVQNIIKQVNKEDSDIVDTLRVHRNEGSENTQRVSWWSSWTLKVKAAIKCCFGKA